MEVQGHILVFIIFALLLGFIIIMFVTGKLNVDVLYNFASHLVNLVPFAIQHNTP